MGTFGVFFYLFCLACFQYCVFKKQSEANDEIKWSKSEFGADNNRIFSKLKMCVTSYNRQFSHCLLLVRQLSLGFLFFLFCFLVDHTQNCSCSSAISQLSTSPMSR